MSPNEEGVGRVATNALVGIGRTKKNLWLLFWRLMEFATQHLGSMCQLTLTGALLPLGQDEVSINTADGKFFLER